MALPLNADNIGEALSPVIQPFRIAGQIGRLSGRAILNLPASLKYPRSAAMKYGNAEETGLTDTVTLSSAQAGSLARTPRIAPTISPILPRIAQLRS